MIHAQWVRETVKIPKDTVMWYVYVYIYREREIYIYIYIRTCTNWICREVHDELQLVMLLKLLVSESVINTALKNHLQEGD